MQASAVKEKVRDLSSTVGPKAGEIRDAIAPKALEVRDAIAPRARELGERVGPKVKTARRKVGFWIAGEEPRKGRRWPAFAAAGAGALFAFFLDPVSGKRRRSVTKDWVAGRFRALGSRTARMGRAAGARAAGYRERMSHAGGEAQPENDAVLAHKVESELFQGRPSLDVSSGQININAENGVVYLRGTVMRPDQVNEIEGRVRGTVGVRDVVNLLHMEGTPAPTR